jgi:hypothetical protein
MKILRKSVDVDFITSSKKENCIFLQMKAYYCQGHLKLQQDVNKYLNYILKKRCDSSVVPQS